MQLFIDADGVIADFDKLAEKIFGMKGQNFEDEFGSREFWTRLKNHGSFFRDLDPMPDAFELINTVRHLNPIILTGAPYGNWAAPQKLAWRDEHFPGIEMIVVNPSRDKFKHMKQPGDILVDDLLKHSQVWKDNDGIFVHHTSAINSINMLKELRVL